MSVCRTACLFLAALAMLGVAGCGGETPPHNSVDFDWDAFLNQDTTPDRPGADTDTRDTSRPPRDVGTDTAELPPGQDGDACATADVCIGLACLSAPNWPGGYCASTGCRDVDDCSSEQSVCASLGGPPVCLRGCAGDDVCRERYSCDEIDDAGTRACVPNFDGIQLDGDACTSDDECIGGVCYRDPEWPGGHCTTLDCAAERDCVTGDFDARCLVRGDQRFCVRSCTEGATCREGYVCRTIARGSGYCAPDVSEPTDVGDPLSYPFDITCVPSVGGRVSIGFDIADDTTAWMVTPYASDGRGLTPTGIDLPDGTVIDLLGDQAFQIVPSLFLGSINPILIPATPALADQLQPGAHTLHLQSNAAEVCWYLLQETAPGATIDLNLYLVGVPGVTAESAPDTERLNMVFDAVDGILSVAGVHIGARRWYDASPELVAAYSVVRGAWAVDALVSSSVLPGETFDEVLSLNIFLTADFAWSDGSGVIGISNGLPGAAGLHGSRASGVVMTSRFADGSAGGTALMATLLAHEMGHFLGLFHTTEFTFVDHDPLVDTPECSDPGIVSCPDLTNLMFPLADVDHHVLTADQAFVLLANPLTRD